MGPIRLQYIPQLETGRASENRRPDKESIQDSARSLHVYQHGENPRPRRSQHARRDRRSPANHTVRKTHPDKNRPHNPGPHRLEPPRPHRPYIHWPTATSLQLTAQDPPAAQTHAPDANPERRLARAKALTKMYAQDTSAYYVDAAPYPGRPDAYAGALISAATEASRQPQAYTYNTHDSGRGVRYRSGPHPTSVHHVPQRLSLSDPPFRHQLVSPRHPTDLYTLPGTRKARPTHMVPGPHRPTERWNC
ncbi:hypothetical protein HPB48_012557 [Haemaphysalis longicornis]|uniref:Uncharacterized protein n=1 Tax=Haemaphysalis longicornis TaxID=44386 RepID=A0A9J6GK30_HAELO|nr:hypothetical protein HPB48_012557 [Haemaphysalis longicornis]